MLCYSFIEDILYLFLSCLMTNWILESYLITTLIIISPLARCYEGKSYLVLHISWHTIILSIWNMHNKFVFPSIVVAEVEIHERSWTLSETWDLKDLFTVFHANLPEYNRNIFAELRLKNSKKMRSRSKGGESLIEAKRKKKQREAKRKQNQEKNWPHFLLKLFSKYSVNFFYHQLWVYNYHYLFLDFYFYWHY